LDGDFSKVINSAQSFIKDPKNDVSFTKAVADGRVAEVNVARELVSGIAGKAGPVADLLNAIFPTKVD